MQNLNYKIQFIKDFNKDNFKEIFTQLNFYHRLLAQDFKIYTNKQNADFDEGTLWIYSIFGICILCEKKENKKSIPQIYCQFENNKTKYTAIYTNDKCLTHGQISQNLRGSSTLKIDEKNCYDNPDIKVVFAEKGFLFQNKYDKSQKDKFEDILSIFILSLAYREKIESFLNTTSSIADTYNQKSITSIKKDIYLFSLKHFFKNPIHYNYQQKYTIWKILFSYYDIFQSYQEVKTQVENLVDILHAEQKEEQGQKDKEREDKRKKTEFILILIGFIISLASLISIYKDLSELLR